MTVDSNHLRGLLARGTPAPWRVGITTMGEGAFGRSRYRDDDADDYEVMNNEHSESEGRQGPVGYDFDGLVALRNNAEELLDRSDAFTEALRLLREWESRTEESARIGEKEGPFPPPELDDFLARFPEEAKR